MVPSPESPGPADPVNDLLREAGPTLRTLDGALQPGASLLMAVECHRRGLVLDRGGLARVAAWLGLQPEELEEVFAFHRDLLGKTGSAGVVTVCRGVSCRLRGALALHERLRTHLDAHGSSTTFMPVLCLAQCEHGPSLMIEDRIYCASEQRIVRDQRHWRDDCTSASLGGQVRPIFG